MAAPFKSAPPHKLRYDTRILLYALATGFPGLLVALILLWRGSHDPKTDWTVGLLIVGCWLGFAFALRERVIRPLQTLANILAALREDDFSIRARGADPNDTLGEVVLEVNALGETLKEQRLGALEATALLRKVMAEIDVSVFTFDSGQRLRLVNRAGERLLGHPGEELLGRTAAELGLSDCLEGEPTRTIQKVFPGGVAGATRWGLSRSSFREGGLPHQLLVLSDLSRALREEELQAWQRLVRVLGHELNNSLAPIKSVAGSLESLLVRQPRAADWETDMRQGLRLIASRSEALSRFMEAYARLARLPRPKRKPMDVAEWIRRVVTLETRLPIRLEAGPNLIIRADGDQLDQLLINLVRNAVDASLETSGGVNVSWSKDNSHLLVRVDDEGHGLSNTANLFVPFFTTKPGGSGIGLVLSRQIAEGHGGLLTLENRKEGPGCEARLLLPL
ncbi:MAG TPA: ATP-binding protein [Terriglobia bacterium]|nr:ATP-binding protein [Terriglobia bacterium]